MSVAEIIREHSDSIEAVTREHCAKIAEIHLRQENCMGDRFYNKAVRDIAASIRKLKGETSS